jgi:hypothetical protein
MNSRGTFCTFWYRTDSWGPYQFADRARDKISVHKDTYVIIAGELGLQSYSVDFK